mgnify:CR=1 FL=1
MFLNFWKVIEVIQQGITRPISFLKRERERKIIKNSLSKTYKKYYNGKLVKINFKEFTENVEFLRKEIE